MSPPIGEPLTFEALESFFSALTIRHLSFVIAKIKLAQVSLKMLSAYVVIDTVDASLEDREVAFDGVGRDANTFIPADILVSRMVHQRMLLAASRFLLATHPCQ